MANRIQMARKAQGLTQKEFGEALGLTQATVSAWEVGRNEPNYKVLREIAQVLNCSIEYLMGYTPSETETGMPPEQRETAIFQESLEIDHIFAKGNLTKAERKRAVEVVRAMFPEEK